MLLIEPTPLNLRTVLGRRLRELRLQRGMSQVELAKVLGVRQSAVSSFEADGDSGRKATFTLATLEQLAWALDAELVIELRPREVA